MVRALLLAALSIAAAAAERPFFLKHGDRVLFLGDSITQAGGYVEYIEAALLAQFPGRRYEVIKLGLSGETVSGLNEPGLSMPRPNLHDRLDRALSMTRPTVVSACYGMNDGIYHPYDEGRFAAYQAGMRRLMEKVREAGARMVPLTPPPFDPGPKGEAALGPGEKRYGYQAPYRDYDGVLARYGRWLLTLENAIDVHGPMSAGRFAPDGVHPGPEGHVVMARAVLDAWGLPLDGAPKPARWKPGLRLEWQCRVPLPAESPCYRLTVAGAPGRVRVFEGDTLLGEAAGEDLARGLDLLAFEKLPANQRAAGVLALVRKRWQVLGPAWLEAVGHARAGKTKALPLPEAERQASALLGTARAMAAPVRLRIRLEAANRPLTRAAQ
jgi:lysophospholipase L1-like esterase